MMNRFTPTFRTSLAMGVMAIIMAAASFAQNTANDPVLQAYLARVAELNREGRALVQEHGKAYVIGEYQALVDAHPDYQKNIQLESRIGEIYEWDYSNRGEPPDIASAYAVYLNIIDRYDSDYEYTKLVYRRAADHAENLDPAAARDLYAGMMEAYSDDPVVQLESLYRLGALAEREGDLNQARELFDLVLNYDVANQALNPDETERIEVLQAQAASLLMALAIDPAATPEERLAALNAFLDDNPDLLDDHGDVVENFHSALNRLKDREVRDEVREAMAELRSLLAERQDARAMVDAPIGQGADDSTIGATTRTSDTNAWPRNDASTRPDTAVAGTAPPLSNGSSNTNAFAGLDTDSSAAAIGEDAATANNRAAAGAAATVCALMAAAALFALRKRFGL